MFLQRFLLDACRDTTLIILMVAAAASLALGIKTEVSFNVVVLIHGTEKENKIADVSRNFK